jgi:hypothetical protein
MARARWGVAAATGGVVVLVAVAVVVPLWLLGYLAPPAVLPHPNARFEQLTLHVTGGISGVDNGVSLRPDGSYLLFTGSGEPAMVTGQGRIGGRRLAGIRDLATSAQLAGESRRPGLADSNSCMDGITTTISMGRFRMAVYDCADHPDVPTFRRLADQLGGLRK